MYAPEVTFEGGAPSGLAGYAASVLFTIKKSKPPIIPHQVILIHDDIGRKDEIWIVKDGGVGVILMPDVDAIRAEISGNIA